MTETSEQPPAPQSIQARIAALRLNEVGRAPGTPPPSYETAAKAKKAPPPPLPKRTQSTSPAVGNGSANGHIGNLPERGRAPPEPPTQTHVAKNVLPAPVMKKWEGREGAVTSPPLPPRRGSEKASPALPARRPSEQGISRKQSVESISSVASGRSSISGMSLGGASGRSTSRGRMMAPEYDPSSLPPLPEKKIAVQEESTPRVPLRPTVSAPNVKRTNGNVQSPPPLPGRPSLPPRTSTATSSNGAVQPPAMPTRPKRSALDMGFNNKATEPPPVPASRPNGGGGFGGSTFGQLKSAVKGFTNGHGNGEQNGNAQHAPSIPSYDGASASPPGDGAVVELTTADFDEVALRSGRPVFVDFYAPFCKYCKDLDPIYEQLAQSYRNSNITIAKIDSYTEKEIGTRYEVEGWPTLMLFDGRGGEPVKYKWTRDLEWMQKFIKQQTGIRPGGAASTSAYPTPPPSNGSSPPPIPSSSRPNLAELNKTKPSAKAAMAPPTQTCLLCRDFSGPDEHAAKFPRQSVPSQDPKWLGPQLCNPFPSHTDKARAIFTWLHHNIDYNVEAFFSGNLKASTPASTMSTGLAVCEGYAALFSALALAAGLEAVVISGHGKGFGFGDLKPGDPLPPKKVDGHAWNAVRIDGGAWKLIDPCWGAGNVKGKGQPYNKDFTPEWFTMSNDDFGKRHYPTNERYWFRDDGRPSISWEEYILYSVGPVERTVFSPARPEHGFEPKSFLPNAEAIPKNGHEPTIRIQWTKVCPHYDIIRHHGTPYLFFVELPDKSQRFAKSDGFNFWIDLKRGELPEVGKEVNIQYLAKYKLGDGEWREGRGLSEKQLMDGLGGRAGWRGWSWSYLARWRVV